MINSYKDVFILNQEALYLFITKPNRWEELSENNEWPISLKNGYILKKLKPGDKVLIYITKESAIAGIIEIVEPLNVYNPIRRYKGDYYNFYATFSINAKLKEGVKIRSVKEMLDKTRGRKNWGASFQRSAMKLGENDFNYLINSVNEKKNAEEST